MDAYFYNLETAQINSYIVAAGRQFRVEAPNRVEAALAAMRSYFDETGRFPYGQVRILSENGVWYGYERPARSWEATSLIGRLDPDRTDARYWQ